MSWRCRRSWTRGAGALAVAFAAELVRRYGVAADVAIHAPSRDGDQRNWHAHVLTTTRAVAADGSLGAKTRALDDRKTGPAEVEALRALWARQVNQMLSWAKAEARVDHRSHARLGLATLPGIHLGATATAMERREERQAHRGGERAGRGAGRGRAGDGPRGAAAGRGRGGEPGRGRPPGPSGRDGCGLPRRRKRCGLPWAPWCGRRAASS